MFRPFLPRPLLFSAAVLFGWLASLASQSVHAQAEKPESKPQIRIICVASLSEDQNVVLASRNQEGKWQEYGELKLRSPFLSAWTPVHAGELHLTLRV